MTNTDARTVKTRQKLLATLAELAPQRGYENLTVRGVAKAAGIGARTFYYHFPSLDHLLAKAVLLMLREADRRAATALIPHQEWVSFYAVVCENQDLLTVYMRLPPAHPARQRVRAVTMKLLKARYDAQYNTQVPLQYALERYINDTEDMVRYFLDHIDSCSVQDAAAMHKDLIADALEHKAIVQRTDWSARQRRR